MSPWVNDPRLPQRFWDKIIVTEDGCWQWTAARINGYGKFWWEGQQRQAHTVAYRRLVGAIPDGLEPDHTCRNRACVNPAHIEPVTRRENLRRANVPSILYGERTCCDNGHEFTPDNTYWRKNGGGRRCKKCHSETVMKSQRKRRAAA